jgi:hypothetical protein
VPVPEHDRPLCLPRQHLVFVWSRLGGEPLDVEAWRAMADQDPVQLSSLGEIDFRRTVYDVERADSQMSSYGDWAERIVHRLEHAPTLGAEK